MYSGTFVLLRDTGVTCFIALLPLSICPRILQLKIKLNIKKKSSKRQGIQREALLPSSKLLVSTLKPKTLQSAPTSSHYTIKDPC